MVKPPTDKPGVAVPAARLSRLLRMGGMAGGVAGRALSGGAREIAGGRRPRAADLVMTPDNARRVAEELSRMRGAAMKVGQLISMDAGDMVPPEIAALLDDLREGADPMPPGQLRDVLDAEWGAGWRRRFASFDVRPMAAASIGQVHRARSADGRDMAIKVQYPGIRDAIDSDVDNLSALLRYSGIVPREVDLAPLLEDAKRQLHEEADYTREAAALERFGRHMAEVDGFRVPRFHADFSTRNVLAMEYMDSQPLSALESAPQEVRDTAAARLIDLVLREIFVLGEMQTDPNFANYRFEPETGRVVLLDFGATRVFPPEVPPAFHRLMVAGLDGDREATRAAAIEVGIFAAGTDPAQQAVILDMIEIGMTPLRRDAPFDYGTSDLAERMRDKGIALGSERAFWHVPATDTLLIQRKIAGTYLLAARLAARVNLDAVVAPYRTAAP